MPSPPATVSGIRGQIATLQSEIRDLKAAVDHERARCRMSDRIADLAVVLRDVWRVHPWTNQVVYDAGQVLFEAIERAEDLERRRDMSTANYKLLGTAP